MKIQNLICDECGCIEKNSRFISFSVGTKSDIHLCAKCFCEFTSNLVNFAKLNFEVEITTDNDIKISE